MSAIEKDHFLKKILVLYVGGTIGMQKNYNGVYVPAPKKLFKYLQSNSKMHSKTLAEKFIKDGCENKLIRRSSGVSQNFIILYEIKEYELLLDSSNMSVKEWIHISKDIENNYSLFDGFVVLHGTDTLAYTASALSFLLEGLEKPVILTGSQIPIYEKESDASENFNNSLTFAGCYPIPEVCIFFASKLLRGNRTTKISSTHLKAFDSPNYPILGETNKVNDIKIYSKFIAQKETRKLRVAKHLTCNVNVLSFFPTITAEMIDCLLQPPTEGLVLESYGMGNVPTHNKILEVLEKGVKAGILIVNITQCLQGRVRSVYEAGLAMEQIGIVSGSDMTVEAAFTKLCFVLSLPNLTYSERAKLIAKNIRGELSINNNFY